MRKKPTAAAAATVATNEGKPATPHMVQLPPLPLEVINTILNALATAPMALVQSQPVFALIQGEAQRQLQPAAEGEGEGKPA